MTALVGPGIDQRFAAHVSDREPMKLRHALCAHPLLDLESIAELADLLGAEHISAEGGVKSLVTAAPRFEEQSARTAADRIRRLAAEDAWFTLLNIEQSAPYRALVDGIVDELAEGAGLAPRRWRDRMGFVFASSPGSVTPAHFDIEHSVLLQLAGRRSLGFGAFGSVEQREREIERYWAGGTYGRLEAMPEQTSTVSLEPGVGVYIPPYVPHWLTNGEEPSLSITVTFFSRSNQDQAAVQVLNRKLRRFGLHPGPYGAAPARDRTKAWLMRGASTLRQRGTGTGRTR